MTRMQTPSIFMLFVSLSLHQLVNANIVNVIVSLQFESNFSILLATVRSLWLIKLEIT